MTHEYRTIAVDLIDVPEDRVRSIKADRVEVLSGDIAENGLLQPVGVVEEESGRFTLVFGAHRLFGTKKLGLREIDARVQQRSLDSAFRHSMRVEEVMENLNREELTKLERAESLALLKGLHEELYPDTAHGKNRKKEKAHGRSEIFSFRHEAAEKTGLSHRAIEIAVSMVSKLSEDLKTRIRGTWLDDHQAGLRLLSEQDAELQHRVCDLLFSTPPEAGNVAEAIILAQGNRLPSAAEKTLSSMISNFSRLATRDRRALFDTYEDEVRAYAKEKGWL